MRFWLKKGGFRIIRQGLLIPQCPEPDLGFSLHEPSYGREESTYASNSTGTANSLERAAITPAPHFILIEVSEILGFQKGWMKPLESTENILVPPASMKYKLKPTPSYKYNEIPPHSHFSHHDDSGTFSKHFFKFKYFLEMLSFSLEYFPAGAPRPFSLLGSAAPGPVSEPPITRVELSLRAPLMSQEPLPRYPPTFYSKKKTVFPLHCLSTGVFLRTMGFCTQHIRLSCPLDYLESKVSPPFLFLLSFHWG